MRTLTLLFAVLSFVPVPSAAQTPVIVQAAKSDQVTERVQALGTLKANESVTLTATVTETLVSVQFEDGQRVQEGQVLVELRADELRAGLSAARASVTEAERQYNRLRPLVADGSVSPAAYDQARRNLDRAQAEVQGLQAQLAQRVIRAPFAGVVGLRRVSVGALVRPGDVLTTLDDDSVMKLDFSVPETRIELVAPGTAIEARARALGDRAFEGTVASLDSRIDPVTRSIVVRALIPNDEGLLRPGQLMTVELLGRPRDAVVIPEQSVTSRGTRHSVFVVEEVDGATVAREREVVLGVRRRGDVEVRSGLAAGDLVVTHGTTRIRDGAPVRVQRVQEGGEALGELIHGDGGSGG